MTLEARSWLLDAIKRNMVSPSALAVGQVIKSNEGMALVVIDSATASGQEVGVYVGGVHRVACAAATTFAQGAPVYWDASGDLAITTPASADDFYMGTADRASGSSQAYVDVCLNAKIHSGLSPAIIASPAIPLDHADATEYVVVNPEENINGLWVLSFHGKVTEQPAGSSEDQLVLALDDEDDNELSTLTTTDTTPDAVGDSIIGTRTLCSAATGVVAAFVPAGKGAKVRVKQATAGTPAGAVSVQAVFLAAG